MNDVTVDARGLVCPQPLLALRDALQSHDQRPVRLELLADDPVVEYDVPAWCRLTNHELTSVAERDGLWTFVITAVD